MMCPGDARCPLGSQHVPTVAVPEGFAPHATADGVADGQLEQQTFPSTNAAGEAVQLTVTSNTPVPNPGGRHGRGHPSAAPAPAR